MRFWDYLRYRRRMLLAAAVCCVIFAASFALYRGGRCEEQFYQEISGTLTLLATGGMEQ